MLNAARKKCKIIKNVFYEILGNQQQKGTTPLEK
jgi:hypothetical protein